MATTKAKQSFGVHPAAAIFPLLEKSDFKDLKADIKANGVRNPVILMGDQILDGRNRFAACEELGIECPTEQYKGNDPVGMVISQNINRRHLTDDARVALVTKLRAKDFMAEAKDSQKSSKKGQKGGGKGEVSTRLAKEAGVSEHKGRAAAKVAKHAPEELDEVIGGKKKLAQAAKTASEKKAAKDKASGKAPKAKKELTLREQVERKWQRFMESFTVQQYREVRSIVRELVATADSKGQAAVAKK